MSPSRDAAHFQRLYATSDDPWNFVASPYEQAKYRHTLDVLGKRRFAYGLEVGCSIGVLTEMLGTRCDALLGVDLVPEPLRIARNRCAGLPGISFAQMEVPATWPDGRFDLIVFSEVLYFLTQADIAACVAHVRASVQASATVLLVNWLGQTDDPCTGDEAAETFMAQCRDFLQPERQEHTADYRLDVLTAQRVG